MAHFLTAANSEDVVISSRLGIEGSARSTIALVQVAVPRNILEVLHEYPLEATLWSVLPLATL